MKELTATEAARRFSDLLDDIEHRGESVVVTRRGRPVARIEPATLSTGAALRAVLAIHRPDRAWAAELASLRSLLEVEERPWPA